MLWTRQTGKPYSDCENHTHDCYLWVINSKSGEWLWGFSRVEHGLVSCKEFTSWSFHSRIGFFCLFVCFSQVASVSGEGNGNPLQYSCLENPRDRGAWWAAVYGVSQSWTRLKWLSSSSSSSHYKFRGIGMIFAWFPVVYVCPRILVFKVLFWFELFLTDLWLWTTVTSKTYSEIFFFFFPFRFLGKLTPYKPKRGKLLIAIF